MILVHRGSKGFGLSLIHRGLDKFPVSFTLTFSLVFLDHGKKT